MDKIISVSIDVKIDSDFWNDLEKDCKERVKSIKSMKDRARRDYKEKFERTKEEFNKENIEKEGKPISEKVWKQLKGEWWEDFWYEEGEKYIDSCGDADKEYIEDFIRDRIHVGIDIKIKDVLDKYISEEFSRCAKDDLWEELDYIIDDKFVKELVGALYANFYSDIEDIIYNIHPDRLSGTFNGSLM